MSKSIVIDKVAAKLGLSKAAATNAVDAVTTAIHDVVSAGGDVQVLPLGKFKLVHKAERQGRNPQSGETMTIPAKDVVTFKASAGKKS